MAMHNCVYYGYLHQQVRRLPSDVYSSHARIVNYNVYTIELQVDEDYSWGIVHTFSGMIDLCA